MLSPDCGDTSPLQVQSGRFAWTTELSMPPTDFCSIPKTMSFPASFQNTRNRTPGLNILFNPSGSRRLVREPGGAKTSPSN